MKAKISRGKSFAGLIRYTEDFGRKATGQKRPELICSTLVADTGRGRVRELVKIASVRPDVEKPVWHCSLSLPPGDHLEPEKWESVVRDFLQGMGMNPDRQPYFAVQHHDTEHEHVHIVLSRVSEDGSLFYGQREAIEAIKVTQELEVKHDLTRTTGLYKRDKSQLKGAEINKALRTGKAPTRLKLQSAIDNCLSGREVTATEFVTTLEAMGVTVTPNISNTGKLSGFAFEADGVTFKGSQLGKGYGLKGLLEKGLTYEQDRESGTLKRVRDRSAERTRSQDHHLERHNAPVAENDRGRDSEENNRLSHADHSHGQGNGQLDQNPRHDEVNHTGDRQSLSSNGELHKPTADQEGLARNSDSILRVGSDVRGVDRRGDDILRVHPGAGDARESRDNGQANSPINPRGNPKDERDSATNLSTFHQQKERLNALAKQYRQLAYAIPSGVRRTVERRLRACAVGIDLLRNAGDGTREVSRSQSGADRNDGKNVASGDTRRQDARKSNFEVLSLRVKAVCEMSLSRLESTWKQSNVYMQWCSWRRDLQRKFGDQDRRKERDTGHVHGISKELPSLATHASQEIKQTPSRARYQVQRTGGRSR